MNKAVIAAVSIFAVLLVLVVATRGKEPKVGIKELKLPPVASADVNRLELTGKHKALLQKDGDRWTVADPAEPAKLYAVEDAAMKTALEAFGDLTTGDFVSERKEKQAELEIDDAAGLRVQARTAKGDALDLVFGKSAKGGGHYVRKAGSDEIYVMKGRLGGALRKDVAGWRKRALVDTKADELAEVSVQPPAGAPYAVVAERAAAEAAGPDGGPAPPPKAVWKLAPGTTLPAGFRLDQEALGRIAQSFATLRAADFATSEEGSGFDQPHTVVSATTTQGKKIVLHLGKEDDKKRVFAKADSDPQVYLIGAYQAKQVGKPLDELRDTTLLAPMKPDDVQKIIVKHGAERVIVERKDGAFALIEPKTTPTGFVYDPAAAQSQAAQLARLRAARRIGAVGSGAVYAETGLQAPDTTVEVITTDGTSHVVKFGKPVVDPTAAKDAAVKEVYVQGDADTDVYAIARFAKDRFDKPLDLFKRVERPAMAGPGGMSGLENLPPDVRKKLEASLKKGPPPPQ